MKNNCEEYNNGTTNNPLSSKHAVAVPIAATAVSAPLQQPYYQPTPPSSYGLVQPFEVIQVHDAQHFDNHGQRYIDGRYRVANASEGHDISETTNNLVAKSSRDGHRITYAENQAAAASTNTGLHLSNHIDRKVLLANYDRPNFDAPRENAKISMVENPYLYASAPPQDVSSGASADTRGVKGGYVIPEYKSMYDDPVAAASSGYEYKSMYDP